MLHEWSGWTRAGLPPGSKRSAAADLSAGGRTVRTVGGCRETHVTPERFRSAGNTRASIRRAPRFGRYVPSRCVRGPVLHSVDGEGGRANPRRLGTNVGGASTSQGAVGATHRDARIAWQDRVRLASLARCSSSRTCPLLVRPGVRPASRSGDIDYRHVRACRSRVARTGQAVLADPNQPCRWCDVVRGLCSVRVRGGS